jgi:hypothetical protein
VDLLIDKRGQVRCVYAEAVDLRHFGPLTIRRASHVEPTEDGRWTADLSPVDGPLMGPFPSRSTALQAEHEWLEQNWL